MKDKRHLTLALWLFAAFIGMPPALYPQEDSPVRWSAHAPDKPVPAGETFEARIEAAIAETWHLYSVTQPPGGPNPTRFSLLTGEPFQIAGAIRQTPPITEFDPNFGIPTEYFADAAEFWLPIRISPGAKPGEYEVQAQVVFQVCDDKVCLPPRKVPIPFKVRIAAAGGAGMPSPPAATLQATASSPTPTTAAEPPQLPSPPVAADTAASEQALSAPGSPEQESAGTTAEVERARARGFLPYLWLAMTMGALSLATPCVFPMIPITVSYFTKKAEAGRSSGIGQALVYCFGIIFTFTGLGLGLAALLGATGINQFAANPWVNLLITGIFVGFALNLFGLYQIGVPSGILTKLAKSGGGSSAQTLLMGLTFTLTSFTCTVPFVGTVLVATSQGEWLWPALGMLGFSVVFAAPFFILAIVPKFLTALPKSGGWMNSVKVTMGFLELAAAMKFISNVDLVWNWQIFTREVVLSVWLAIAVLTAVYLLGKFSLPHDTPVQNLGVLRMSSALLFLSLGFYLFTGLIGGSLGELDAFLPPRTSGGFTLTGSGEKGYELTWHRKLDAALAEARAEQKPVFIDFTGYTCTNCRWMEANIFPLPAIHAQLKKFARLQLFTDGAGQEYEDNQRYQKEQYGTVALPLYALLDQYGNKIASFPGMTRKPEEFLQFLRIPFETAPGSRSEPERIAIVP